MRTPRSLASLLALAGILILPTSLTAQLEAVDLHLGLARSTLGGGFADLASENDFDVSSRTGFVAGASIDYAVNERLSVRAGLGIAQKGYRITDPGGDDFRLLDITYLEIPVLATLAFESGAWTPYVMAGPVLSMEQSTYGEIDGEEVDTEDAVSGSDVGLAVGLGARKDRVGAEIRYVHGLTNISPSDDENETANNRHWAVAVTYRIPMGG